ncbi:Predicted arabinose efflux permease, MFS family [Gracilibacillus kekensis]|uniref:Predicted arabinose efflux permease, MFS family n=1 Tax=Gracilibacillus kekensis TaxID=1027249 RepID=A0A1M7LAE1_9BACI|nr:Predicted arabinose efflux permease, MFS family [Gracilibacillus kekensis]
MSLRARNEEHPVSKTHIKLIAFITAVSLLGDSMLYVVLPIFPELFGLNSLWEVGVLLAVNRFVRIPIHPFVKMFYQYFTIRQGLFIGLILSIITTLSYGILETFLWLLISRIVWGIAWSFLKQGGQLSVVYAVGASNQQLASGQLTGIYNGISRTGSLAGMLLGGIGASLFGPETLFFVFACLATVLIPFLVRDMRNQQDIASEKPDNQKAPVDQKTIRNRTFLFLLTMGLLLSMIYQGVLTSTLGYWIVFQEDLTTIFLGGLGAAAWTGILQGFRWGLEPVIAPWIGRKADKIGSKLILLIPTLVVASGLFLILPAFIPTVAWLFAVIILLVTATIVSTLLDAFVTDYTVHFKKNAIISHYLTASDLGAALGPALGFLLIEMAGEYSVVIGGAVILMFTAVLASWEHWHTLKNK